jgi:hypothetical protein
MWRRLTRANAYLAMMRLSANERVADALRGVYREESDGTIASNSSGAIC